MSTEKVKPPRKSPQSGTDDVVADPTSAQPSKLPANASNTPSAPSEAQKLTRDLKRAQKNDHEAQYRLAKLYAQGAPGVPRDKRQSHYWLSRAALGSQKDAVAEMGDKNRYIPFTVREYLNRKAKVHLVAGSLIVSTAALCVLTPLFAIAAAGLTVAIAAGILYIHCKRRHFEETVAIDPLARRDHAAAQLGDTRKAHEIFERTIRTEEATHVDKRKLVERLFAVPENRPFLEMAACLMADGTIAGVNVRPPEPGEEDWGGSRNEWRHNIFVDSTLPTDYLAHAVTHELMHFVLPTLKNQTHKTYSSWWGKANFELETDASRPGEIRALTMHEHHVALFMNACHTEPDTYAADEYKAERDVVIPGLLAENYEFKPILKRDYALEWERFRRRAKACNAYVAQRRESGQGIEITPPCKSKPCRSPDIGPRTQDLVAAVFKRAAGKAYGDVRAAEPATAVWGPAKKHLTKILESRSVTQRIKDKSQLSAFCDALAKFYAPCYSGTASKREYDFSGIGKAALDKEVARLIELFKESPKVEVHAKETSGRAKRSSEKVSTKSNYVSSRPSAPRKVDTVVTIMDMQEADIRELR